MDRFQNRTTDDIVACGLAVSVAFALRGRAHFLVRASAAAFGLAAAVRLLRKRTPPPSRTDDPLVAIVAHEIRGPLASIRGAASLLEQYESQLEGERRRKLVRAVLDAAGQLSGIVDDLLLVSRIDAGNLPLERTELDLDGLVRDAMPEGEAQRIALVAQKNVPQVLGDPVRVRQVVGNLVSNALAYATEQSLVIVAVAGEGATVRTSIFNEGNGIPPEEQSKLFLPFARLSERRIDSTGLGLYIAKQLVEAMGGRIGFTTDPGRNAVFWFTLPAARSTVLSV